MAEKRDYYEVLGLNKSATPDEIKSAYRKLAKQYHPDLNKAPDAEQKFKEVQEAYDVLSDSKKKAQYDQFGHAAFDPNSGAGGFGGGFGGFQDVDLGDIFGSFFGGGGRTRRNPSGPLRGNDSYMQIRISFMDAINGKRVEIPVTFDEPCSHCNGTGAQSSSDIETCPTCHGTGTVKTRQQTIFGTMESQSECPNCHGTGKVIKNKCSSCNGKGYNRVKKNIEVNIPAGINQGQQIRIAGKGERGLNGGPNGDLFIEILVTSDSNFQRDGNDIHLNLELSMVDAALGCTLNVKTVYGDVEMSVPEGTQSGQTLRLKGKGVRGLKGTVGDQFVHFKILTPTKLTQEQKQLLEKFMEIEETKSKKSDNIFDKIKKGFKGKK